MDSRAYWFKRLRGIHYLTFWVGFHLSEGNSPLWGSSTGGCRMEMHTSPFWIEKKSYCNIRHEDMHIRWRNGSILLDFICYLLPVDIFSIIVLVNWSVKCQIGMMWPKLWGGGGFMTKTKMFHLINVGVPHLGEEAESWWRVWVVNWKLDVSLEEQRDVDS